MTFKRLLMTLMLITLSITACNSATKTKPTESKKNDKIIGLSSDVVTIKTVHGNIKFKFYDKDAPNTSKRIRELVKQGFYNGLIFHRVVPGFVIQGGDPTGTGTSGSGKKLKAEFNERKHVLGTVAMARAQSPDSADSQFYISMGAHPHLDRNYTVFAQVVEGHDIIKKVRQGDKMISVTVK